MDDSNKDLLHLESNNASATTIESRLLVNLRQQLNPKPKPSGGVPLPTAPKSQVLEKVKDFLGVISEANKRLDDDAKDNAKDYNIEVLTGNESEYIEMDLMLGVADLHTPEAVAAAESAIAGSHADMLLASGQNESESEDSEDDDDNDDKSDDDDNQNTHRKRSKLSENEFREASENCKSKRRPNIVELP